MHRRAAALFTVALLSCTISAHVAFASTSAAATSPIGAIEEFTAGLIKSTEAIIASIESAVGNIAASIGPSGSSPSYTASAAAPEAAPQVAYPSTAPAPLPPPPAVVAAPPISATPTQSSDNIFKLQSAIAELTEGVQGLTALYEAQTPSSKIESQIAALQSALASTTANYNASTNFPLGDGTGLAAASKIGNLSGVTITNANISAASIPDLSGSYLLLGGGALTGSLGIGTTTPGSLLSLGGIANFTAATSTLYSSGGFNIANGCYAVNGICIGGSGSTQWTTTGSNIYFGTGNIGIGTTSPSQALSVQGNALFSGNINASAGTTTLNTLDLGGNILSTQTTASAPSSVASWNSISTAFTGDLSHLGLGLSHSTTGTSLGTPSSGYLITRELADIASYDYNSAGYNADTGDNNGRTGALNLYAKNDNYGQGDSTSYFCDGFVDNTRSGATSFLAEPEVGCLGGQLFAGANGDLLEGIGDINFKDQGHDAAVVGLNFNFARTNATGNLNANWGAWTFQNQGTLPIDWMLRATGAVRTGLDLSALTFPDYTLVGVSLNSGGSGYSVGDLLIPPDGTYSQQTVFKVLTVNGSGTILTFGLDRAGLYSVAPASPSTVSGGTGTGASFILQYSTGGNPAIITPANDCWYGNATQDTSVYVTSYSSTLKLGTSWICYSSSLGAWNFISGNQSILQLYSNQAIVNTNLKVTGSTGIGTTSPATTLAVNGSGYFTAGLGIGLLNTATGTLQTTGTTTIEGLATLQSGFVSQASSTVVGNLTSTGNGTFGGTLALNSTTGTSSIASGQGFTVGSSQFVVQQGSGNVGIGSTNPTAPLFVSSTLHGVNELAFINGNNGHNLAGLFVDGSSNAWWRLYNSSNVETVRFNSAGTSYIDGGNVAIGTSTPYSTLEVFGPDAASSTSAFAVVNTSSSTVFAVFDGGNAQLSGTLTQSSDQRLKTNIQDLDGSSSLAKINALNPVTFNWIDPNQDNRTQLGFIAQQVQGIFPSLVSTTSPTTLTPAGTLGLNYIDLISPIVAAIQELDKEITSLAATVAHFAESITSQRGTFTDELCVGSTCVTPAQFQAMVAAADQSASAPASPSPSMQTATDTPPVIQINGSNPATIQVGASYTDLGATITGPQGDLNLGIQTYLNGTLESPITLDTSAAATDTIAYVVTDSQGLTSTSTRTVIVEPAAAPPAPLPAATSSSATTTVE